MATVLGPLLDVLPLTDLVTAWRRLHLAADSIGIATDDKPEGSGATSGR